MPQTEYAAPVSQGDQDSTVLRKIAYAAQNGSGGGGLTPSGVTPGSYTNTNLTVDVNGIITAASNGFNPASPGPLGGTTPASGAFTTLSATPGNDATGLTITGGSITGSGATPFQSITGTWNTTGTPSAIRIDIANTASGDVSSFFHATLNGANLDQARLDKHGGWLMRTSILTGNAYLLQYSGNDAELFRVRRGGELYATSLTSGTSLEVETNSLMLWSSKSVLAAPSDGVIRLTNNALSDFNRLQFGGTTNSFPSIKRSLTIAQARLADDSDFCPLQGQLRTHANAVAETPTATHTLVIQDATGTSYKVLAVVA